MNAIPRFARRSILAIATLVLPLRAQEGAVPVTRTLPFVDSSAFPYAKPETVGLSSERLARHGPTRFASANPCSTHSAIDSSGPGAWMSRSRSSR